MNQGRFSTRARESWKWPSTLSLRRQEPLRLARGTLDAAVMPSSSGAGRLGLKPFPHFESTKAQTLSTTRTKKCFTKNPGELVLYYIGSATR